MARRLPLALFYLAAGALHFAKPRVYEAIVPDALPAGWWLWAWRAAARRT